MNTLAFFDLEWTAWAGSRERRWRGPGEAMEIVQIGAVLIEDTQEMAETGALNVIVRPRLNPDLSDYFIDLTGITQQRVDSDGVAFPDALARLFQFVEGATAVYSMGGDEKQLAINCRIHGIDEDFSCIPFANARHPLNDFLGIADERLESGRLPAQVGFEMDGNAHDGLDDARMIAEAFRIMRRAGAF